MHNLDPAFYALDLGAPLAAQAQDSGLGQETYAAWQIITFEFAAQGATGFEDGLVRRGQAAAKTWRPRGRSATSRQRHPVHRRAGIDVVRWLVRRAGLFPASRREEFQRPPKTIPRSSGHRAEWIQACKDRKPEDAKAGFAYSGPFTEALLVGNLAVRLQKRVEWDSANLRAGTRRRPRRSFARTTGPGLGSSHA